MIGYKLVGDITVATATTSVNFTGLNITSTDSYLLVTDTVIGSVSSDIYITINNNNIYTNYYTQYLTAYSSSFDKNRVNYPKMCWIGSDYPTSSTIVDIQITNSGYFVAKAKTNRRTGAALELELDAIASTFTASSINTLSIISAQVNGIQTGSRFRLYKLTAKKVADITVSAATTLINITGLNIDKTSEYMLVGNILDASATGVAFRIYTNANATATSYYTQYITVSSTAVSGDRANISLYAEATGKTFSVGKFKLTNTGYFVCQSDYVKEYGGSSVELRSAYTTSTFTADSITSLSIQSSVASRIGIGSRFQLYKLK